MNNLREVNDDIGEYWLMFRDDQFFLLLVRRIENIGFILMKFLRKS